MWTAGVAGGIWKSTDGGATLAAEGRSARQHRGELAHPGSQAGQRALRRHRRGLLQRRRGARPGHLQVHRLRRDLDAAGRPPTTPTSSTSRSWPRRATRTSSASTPRRARASSARATRGAHLDQGAGCAPPSTAAWTSRSSITRRTSTNYVFASCGTFAQATVWRALDVEQGQVWEPVLSEAEHGTHVAGDRAVESEGDLRAGVLLPPGWPRIRRTTRCWPCIVRPQNGAAGTWETRVALHRRQQAEHRPAHQPGVRVPRPTAASARPNQFFNQGWYDNQIAVDPKDENIVWTAGIDLMRSDDGGAELGRGQLLVVRRRRSQLRARRQPRDHVPSEVQRRQQPADVRRERRRRASHRRRARRGGHDAGQRLRRARRRTRSTWTSLNNGYQVTQFYHGAVYPDGSTFFGGTQDNGTLRGDLTRRPELGRRSSAATAATWR